MELTPSTVALITGASSGIGRALALAMANHGLRVALIARRERELASVVREIESQGGKALGIPCDVTDQEAFSRAVEHTIDHFGALDILINNAGRGHLGYISDTSEEHIENIFRVNVFSLWYGTAVAIPHMVGRGRGQIVNIASVAGKIGYPGNAAYVAAKHATVGFTRALRAELAGTGVEAMTVVPGATATAWPFETEGGPMIDLFTYEELRGREIAAQKGIILHSPLPLLAPEEVAEGILEAIRHPVAEFYTHPASHELVAEYERNQEETEKRLEPLWLANREGYENLKNGEQLR